MANQAAVWKGLLAGLVGGLVASAAMGPIHELAQKADRAPAAGDEEDATMKVAEAVSETVADQPLTKEQRTAGGAAVHFAFGGGMGAAYGALAEVWPAAATGFGAPFGAAVYGGAHAAAVPALGLAKPVTEAEPKAEAAEFAAHLLYGVVTDVVRMGVRKMLD